MPSMARRSSSRYIASAAASSAAPSLPRPRHNAAATAVASVTRTISSAKARSSSVFAGAFDTYVPPPPGAHGGAFGDTHSLSQFFDTDHLRLLVDMAVALDGVERFANRGLGGLMGNEHNKSGRVLVAAIEAGKLGARAALHDALDGDALIGRAAGDGRA